MARSPYNADLSKSITPENNPLADSHFLVNLRVFDDEYPVLVRKEMRVDELINQIKDKLANEIAKERDYLITLNQLPLDLEAPLSDFSRFFVRGVQTLIFQYDQSRSVSLEKRVTGDTGPLPAQAAMPVKSVRPSRVTLKNTAGGPSFVITSFPALIGRVDFTNPQEMAVDLGDLTDTTNISRRHAQILYVDDAYYLEQITTHSKTFVKDTALKAGEKRRIQSGDQIRIGNVFLLFIVEA